ncbi:hypothetical protein PR202_gb13800 [Eleusine coracana subsp. coracana]|uniref:Uncharacterized protein n=1 Tax=Eleusine coracana subsp. coracana TaxID=191504 RepID=A0AAV5ERH7_ELECO|nr:hypothetical protein PR202_gb13800 [Eleusine coracana subsp. coracana]
MAAVVKMPAVFGESQPDDDHEEQPRRPVLFHAQGQGLLRVVATDLHSLAWRRSLALPDIHDLVCTRYVGIAGSCSDFLDYLYSSLSSGHVKLSSSGPDSAKLMATKAKGLPRITISLDPVAPSALSDVIADFSHSLYAAFKNRQEQAAAEQEQIKRLMESLSSERVGYPYQCSCCLLSCWERNEVMQKQLEGLSFLDKRKATKPKLVTDQLTSLSAVPPVADQVIVPVQQQTSVVSPSKVPPAKSTKRIAPVPRRLLLMPDVFFLRARARGALLQDTEENGSDE